jgi:hypothetical protein
MEEIVEHVKKKVFKISTPDLPPTPDQWENIANIFAAWHNGGSIAHLESLGVKFVHHLGGHLSLSMYQY